MITLTELAQFTNAFYATPVMSRHQRYGQALLNAFHDHSGVAEHRSDPLLWESNSKHDVVNRLYELNLIDNTR